MGKLNRNTIVTRLKESLTDPEAHPKEIIGIFLFIAVVLGIFSFILQFSGEVKEITKKSEGRTSIDTLVPEGKVLLEVKIVNYESLDQIIGNYGVVDLYTTPLNPDEKPRKLAYAVKIVKAPGNPRIFSVLLSDQQASPLIGYKGEYTVLIRNPKTLGTKVVKPRESKPKRRIVYEWENV